MTLASANYRRSPSCEFIRISADGNSYYQEVNMTTPQNQLYVLADRIKNLTELFECEDDEDSIFETIRQIDLRIKDVRSSQLRQEYTMDLILKLMSKHESS